MSHMVASSQEQLAEDEQRAQIVYDTRIRPILRPEDDGKYVAIAVESGDYEIDANDFLAGDRLRSRQPEARIWMMRAGRSAAYRFAGTIDLGDR